VQYLRARPRALGLVQCAADGRIGRRGIALGEPQQRQPRLRTAAGAARLAIALLGGVEVAAHTAEFGMLVERRRRFGGVARGQALAGATRFRRRVVPRAVQLQQLGSPHETLSAERHHVGVRGAPRRHRIGPLLGPPLIEQIVTRAEHAAVDDAGHDRSDFSGRDGHHHFVEAGHAGGRLLLPEHGAPFGMAGQGGQVGVLQPLADCAGIGEVGVRARQVALARLPAAAQAQEEPACHGIPASPASRRSARASQPPISA
jgi:hypothetical protein